MYERGTTGLRYHNPKLGEKKKPLGLKRSNSYCSNIGLAHISKKSETKKTSTTRKRSSHSNQSKENTPIVPVLRIHRIEGNMRRSDVPSMKSSSFASPLGTKVILSPRK
jgi:hypothetical protein